ncbi:hypothetical protein IMCC14465_08150 [alpha proteobacterium IMCC14465]|uniref:N-acetyltransferase domain-containing protein n=1 Tax=alpha proteobacterium IMCC14465 TaxID=1220535 RepID=J9DZC9_9PROT|nr:hypothetical protein IMCC14465_08150 [alpha proteobacterium IMCC14465]
MVPDKSAQDISRAQATARVQATAEVEAIDCPAQPDPAFLAEIHKAGFTSSYEQNWDAQAMAEMLAMNGVCVHQFFAGFIMTRISFDVAEILTFAIQPDQRGKGWGVALLKAAMLYAFEKGASRMLLEVAPDREAALGLYRRAGFIRTGIRKNYYQGPDGKRDAILMETGLGTEPNFR